MKKSKLDQKIIVFLCNWHALSSLESAGRERNLFSANVYPVLLSCLGRITPGIILKAFENGADGVCLVGCSEGDCQHNTGNLAARKVFEESKNLLQLLGYNDNQLMFSLMGVDDGKRLAHELDHMLAIEKKNQD